MLPLDVVKFDASCKLLPEVTVSASIKSNVTVLAWKLLHPTIGEPTAPPAPPNVTLGGDPGL